MLEKYMKHSDKLQKMQKNLENVRKKIFIKKYCKKIVGNVRKCQKNL